MNRKRSSGASRASGASGAAASVARPAAIRSATLVVGLAVAAAIGAAGCATTSADFRLSEIGPSDAAIAGRLTIIYNSRIFTENCTATFGGRALKLSPGGIVLFHVRKGWTSLARLDCKDTSNQHIRLGGAHFFAHGDGWVSDFGDVVITWTAVGGFKASSMFGLIGAMVDEASDDGVASLEAKSPAVEVREAFRHQTGVEGRWLVQPLSQPKNAVAQAYAAASDPEAPDQTGPAGFFCASSPTGRTGASFCERELAACERVRAALPRLGLAACAPAETAWCFVTDARLRCSRTRASCEAQHENTPAPLDACGEQY